MKLWPLFSTPVVEDNFECDIDMNYIVNQIQYKTYKDKNSGGRGSVNQSILLEKEFEELRNRIESRLSYFLYSVLKFTQGNIKHASSWINWHRQGDWAELHAHENSVYSGIYYIKCHENCGRLWFHHPYSIPTFSSHTVQPEISEFDIYNSKRFFFDPKDGDLVLFPSHLEHRTEKNLSGEDRICLAFNYFIEGEMGSSTNMINCKIS